MKIFILVMILALPGVGTMPPIEQKMETLEACVQELERRTKEMAELDEDFKFVAGCRVESKKLDPV